VGDFAIFEKPEQTNDPERVNKALSDVGGALRTEIETSKGKAIVNRKNIQPGSQLDSEKLVVEFNDNNKRLLVKIDGVLFSVGSLTEVT